MPHVGHSIFVFWWTVKWCLLRLRFVVKVLLHILQENIMACLWSVNKLFDYFNTQKPVEFEVTFDITPDFMFDVTPDLCST